MNPEIQNFIAALTPYIHSYSYLVVFFSMMLENMGIPIPAETALIAFSFIAGQGILNIWLVIPIAIIGDVAGDNVGFLIGRVGGRKLIKKYGRFLRMDKKKVDAVEMLFKKRGGSTVFSSQFFAATRISIALVAGFSQFPFYKFLTYDFLAAILFVLLISGSTFYFGKNLDQVLRFLHFFRFIGLIVLVSIILFYIYRSYRKIRQNS